MKKSFHVIAMFLVAIAASASAQEAAELVQTNGFAELTRASVLMIDPAARSTPIRLPATVRRGEIISIAFEVAGKTVADSFMVTGITIKDDICSIENQRHTGADSAALSDTIHARPCRRIK